MHRELRFACRRFVQVTLLLMSLWIPSAAVAEEKHFELLHLWVTDTERHALKSFSEPIKRSGVAWAEHGISTNFYGIRTTLAERIALGLAPAATFWIGGEELTSQISAKRFLPIPAMAGNNPLHDNLLPEIREVVSVEGGLSAIPAGIHVQNHAIYSSKILNELNLSVPSSWKAFLEMAPKMQNAGYMPLAMSDQRWQIRFLFLSILAEQLKAGQFLKLLEGKLAPEKQDAVLDQALGIFGALREYAPADSLDKPWAGVIDSVRQDAAALSILGDFSCPMFTGEANHIFSLAPGNKYMLWSFDVIAFVNQSGGELSAGQRGALNVMSKREARQSYIVRKGGIPAYTDISVDELGRCSQESARHWRENSDRILLDSGKWGGQLNAIASICQKFWRDKTMPLAVAKSEIKGALERVWPR